MAFETVGMTLKGKAFTMEVAERSAQIERGLMYRDAMDPDHGMLFVFDEPSITAFWMANTRIPLDIIFLDKTARVMEIHQRKPFDEESRGPARPVQYVIELNVGMAEKIGLKTGDQIEIPRKYLKTAAAPSD